MTKRTEYPSAAVRIRAMKRDRFRCTYCGAPGTDAELEIDHIVPVSKGGSHHVSNLTTSCRECNQKKGNGAGEPRVNDRPGGLVGMFLHTYRDGKIHYQGHVVGVDGEMALVQLFSWWDGSPTNVEAMPKSFIYSAGCKLYETNEDMIVAYGKDIGNLDLPRRWRKVNEALRLPG